MQCHSLFLFSHKTASIFTTWQTQQKVKEDGEDLAVAVEEGTLYFSKNLICHVVINITSDAETERVVVEEEEEGVAVVVKRETKRNGFL